LTGEQVLTGPEEGVVANYQALEKLSGNEGGRLSPY